MLIKDKMYKGSRRIGTGACMRREVLFFVAAEGDATKNNTKAEVRRTNVAKSNGADSP